jgi:hypothetical protein
MHRRQFVKIGISASALYMAKSYALSQGKDNNMILENLKQPPNNSTLMGVIKGVSNYYDLKYSDAMIYGGSGHAFFINIHKDLCPSGPYLWNRGPFLNVLQNLGIEMVDQGFFWNESSKEERTRIEGILKTELDKKEPCALLNMEYQIISGYDETGFITAQPWAPNVDFPQKHLTFESWAEMNSEIHVNYFTFKHIKAKEEKEIIKQSLLYAVNVFQKPSEHTSEPFFTGEAAYDAWINAVNNGNANSHGCWWNGTVWCECRTNASQYFKEIAQKYSSLQNQAETLSMKYELISDGLRKAADKNVEGSIKISTLKDVKTQEMECISLISEFLRQL